MLLSTIFAIDFPSWLSGDIVEIGPITLRWYGIGFIAGLFLAYLYALRMTKRRDIWVAEGPTRVPEVVPTEAILSDLMFYCLIGIIVGGRLGYIILYAPETFVEAPLDVLKPWQGGMSFHGGFLGVVLACAFTSWRTGVSKMRIGDMASMGAPIGLGLVRVVGNFFNQELWGRPTDVPWEMIFPKDPDLLPRHPSQLYEAFLEGLVLFLILRFMMIKYKALTKPGLLFGALMFFYGLFRFSVEFVREPDDIAQFGMLTRGMAYSLPMVLAGAVLMIWAARRAPVSPKRLPEPEKKTRGK